MPGFIFTILLNMNASKTFFLMASYCSIDWLYYDLFSQPPLLDICESCCKQYVLVNIWFSIFEYLLSYTLKYVPFQHFTLSTSLAVLGALTAIYTILWRSSCVRITDNSVLGEGFSVTGLSVLSSGRKPFQWHMVMGNLTKGSLLVCYAWVAFYAHVNFCRQQPGEYP